MYYTPKHRDTVAVQDERKLARRIYGKHRSVDSAHRHCGTHNCVIEPGPCVDAFIMWEQRKAQNV